MQSDEQKRLIEALILAAAEPIGAARLADIVPGCDAGRVRTLVGQLNDEYTAEGRAFRVESVAGGYQLRTRSEFAPYLQQLRTERPLRLSNAALETLAIIAYKQPATRAEIEHIRGVEVGAVLRGLLERHLIRLAGHREVPGRPLLYGTTRRFLEIFGLNALSDLPTLREIEELAPVGAEGADEGAAPQPPGT